MSMKTFKPLALPRSVPNVARKFPHRWAELPLHARVLFAAAEGAGITILHTDGSPYRNQHKDDGAIVGWCWFGTADQFRSCRVFRPSQSWEFLKWQSTYTGEGLFADLLREEDGTILAHIRGVIPIGRKSHDRFVALAAGDFRFQAFMSAALKPVETDSLRIHMSERLLADIAAYGVFPELRTELGKRLSPSTVYFTVSLEHAGELLEFAESMRTPRCTRRQAIMYGQFAGRLRRDIARQERDTA